MESVLGLTVQTVKDCSCHELLLRVSSFQPEFYKGPEGLKKAIGSFLKWQEKQRILDIQFSQGRINKSTLYFALHFQSEPKTFEHILKVQEGVPDHEVEVEVAPKAND